MGRMLCRLEYGTCEPEYGDSALPVARRGVRRRYTEVLINRMELCRLVLVGLDLTASYMCLYSLFAMDGRLVPDPSGVGHKVHT
jgi:hypothetical protein